MNIKTKKIFRLISKIILIIIGLGVLGYFGYFVYRSIAFKPQNIVVTNVTDVSATVTWTTSSPMNGVVYYSKDNNILAGPLGIIGTQKAYDDRDVSNAQTDCVAEFNQSASESKDSTFSVDGSDYDCTNVSVSSMESYYTHSITITNLDPESTYYFVAGNGLWSFKEGANSVKTFSTLEDVEEPKPLFGKVLGDDNTYSDDGFVYITFSSSKDQKESVVYSSTLNSDGGWYLDATGVRDSEGNILNLELTNDSFTAKAIYSNYGASDALKFVLGEFNVVYPSIIIERTTQTTSKILNLLVNKVFAACDTDHLDQCSTAELETNMATWGYGKVIKYLTNKNGGDADQALTDLGLNNCEGCSNYNANAVYGTALDGTATTIVVEGDNVKGTSEDGTVQTCQINGYSCTKTVCTPNECSYNSTANTHKICKSDGSGWGDLSSGACASDNGGESCSFRCAGSKKNSDDCASCCDVHTEDSTCKSIYDSNYCSTNGVCEAKTGGGYRQCVNHDWAIVESCTVAAGSCSDGENGYVSEGSYCYSYSPVKKCISGACTFICSDGGEEYKLGDTCSDGVSKCTNTGICVGTGGSCTVTPEYDTSKEKYDNATKKYYYSLESCSVSCNGGASLVDYKASKCTQYFPNISDKKYVNGGNYSEGVSVEPIPLDFDSPELYWDQMQDMIVNDPSEDGAVKKILETSVSNFAAEYDGTDCNLPSQDEIDAKQRQCWAVCGGTSNGVGNFYWKETPNNNKICTDPSTGAEYHPDVYSCTCDAMQGLVFPSLVSKIYATEESDSSSSSYTLFLPESGSYSFQLNGSTISTKVSDGNTVYIFYIESNGEAGFQMPVDSANPTSSEDIVLSTSAYQITYTQETTAQQYDIKKGINLISFDFIATNADSEAYTAGDVITQAATNGVEIQYITTFDGGRWSSGYSCSSDTCTGTDFTIVPGKGYLVYATENGTVTIPGYNLTTSIPLALSAGWNLVGIHGYTTAYTARTFIDSINTITGLTADNVSWWPTAKGKYEGLSVENNTEYGLDFSLSSINGYFVRISDFEPEDTTCKSIIWNPEGTLNGTCGNTE